MTLTTTVDAETLDGTTKVGTVRTAPVTAATNVPLPPTIQTTEEYTKFTFIKGNRRVDPRKVKRLKVSMRRINLCHVNPIIVSSNHAILDGQHRYIACVDLKLPIYYIVVDNLDLTVVAMINSNQDQWKWYDYLNTYCELNYHHYKVFKGFMRRYDLNFTVTMIMMYGEFSHGLYDKFKDGGFSTSSISLERANEWASRVQALKDVYTFYKDRGFILAVTTMWKHEDYDHEHFMNKVASAGGKVVKSGSRLDYLRQLEELYNWKARKGTRVRFF